MCDNWQCCTTRELSFFKNTVKNSNVFEFQASITGGNDAAFRIYRKTKHVMSAATQNLRVKRPQIHRAPTEALGRRSFPFGRAAVSPSAAVTIVMPAEEALPLSEAEYHLRRSRDIVARLRATISEGF